MSAQENPPTSSSTSSQLLILGLQKSLESCSKAIEDGDFQQSEASISELVESLSSIFDDAISIPDDEETQINSIAVLSYIHSYLSNPSLDQAVIDALSFELPKAIAKFAGVSLRCSELVDSMIDLFTTKCPRDMIAVCSEALASYGETTDAPGYVASLLRGVSKVFLSIQRRHFEQIKVAVPIILNALKAASFDLDDGDVGLENLFKGAISIAESIQETCKKLEGEASAKLHSLLGLYVLQVMALVSTTMGNRESAYCLSFVQQLSSFFPFCGLSYAKLINGHGIDPLVSLVCDGGTNDYTDCFSYVKHGAVLSVIWGHISDEVTQAAKQDVNILKDELRSNQNSRWSAVCSMKYVFIGNLPWILKKHALEFLLGITENVGQEEISDDITCSFHTTSLTSTLQAITTLIMTAPDAGLRKMAFIALKSVLADNPSSSRLDMMQFLIRTSSSPSMTGILIDCVRENLRHDYVKLKEAKIQVSSSFWNGGILDLVEFVLRHPGGGPPSLPEQCDAVLSALNLYRYVLITESTGKTNHTGVMSRSNLQKFYNDMLLPLRIIVSAMISQTKNDGEQFGFDIMCGLNPVEFVLYRCIELVEENIKQ